MPTAPVSRRRARRLAAAPLRRRGLAVAPTLVASLVAAGVALLLPAQYRAAAILQGDWAGDEAAPAREQDRELSIRRTREVTRRVTDGALLERTLQQANPYGVGAGAAPLARQVDHLRSDLRVRPMAATSFAVEFEHTDPVKAALVPNVLTSLLVDDTLAAQAAARPQEPGSPGFELAAPARVPSAPEPRHPLLFALAGALVGLLVGVAAAVAAEARDHSVKGPEDLEEILKAPLLASLPEVETREGED